MHCAYNARTFARKTCRAHAPFAHTAMHTILPPLLLKRNTLLRITAAAARNFAGNMPCALFARGTPARHCMAAQLLAGAAGALGWHGTRACLYIPCSNLGGGSWKNRLDSLMSSHIALSHLSDGGSHAWSYLLPSCQPGCLTLSLPYSCLSRLLSS